MPESCTDTYCGPIPREEVCLDDYVPAWANPGWLEHGYTPPRRPDRRCEVHDVAWSGLGECFVCEGET